MTRHRCETAHVSKHFPCTRFFYSYREVAYCRVVQHSFTLETEAEMETATETETRTMEGTLEHQTMSRPQPQIDEDSSTPLKHQTMSCLVLPCARGGIQRRFLPLWPWDKTEIDTETMQTPLPQASNNILSCLTGGCEGRRRLLPHIGTEDWGVETGKDEGMW